MVKRGFVMNTEIKELTSAQANKLLKKLKDEYAALIEKENSCKTFKASVGEDIESVRPPYDYAETRAKLDLYSKQIRTIKHAVNVFNCTHKVDGYDMTIDEMLVYIPQLTNKKSRLAEMRSKTPKERVDDPYSKRSAIIEYVYANYDLNAAETDYQEVSDELTRAQLALDITNNGEKMKIELIV